MSDSTITVHIDDKDKAAFDHFCDEIGLDASAAITLFIKTVLRENRIPFEVDLNHEHIDDWQNGNTDKLLALSSLLMQKDYALRHMLSDK